MQTPQQFCGLLYTVANEIEIPDFDCKIPNYIGDAVIKPKMLGHLVIRVRDAKRSEDFYHDVLGLEVRNRTRGGKMVFLTSNPEIDHEIALAELGPNAVGPFPDQVGLYHMAWELADMDELKDAYQVVLDNKVDIAGFGDHGETKGLYIRDSDGIEIELFANAPEFEETPLEEILTGGSRQGAIA
jgi:catechol-2,3-dioxygenase